MSESSVVTVSYWKFSPSLAASIVALVLFSATTALHIKQALYSRQSYSWVICISGICQVLTYIFRTISIELPTSFDYYAAWFVLILIAPLWTNAFVYMVLGRMVHQCTEHGRVWFIKTSQFSITFIVLDLIALVVQVCGAAQAAGKDVSQTKILDGLHIYMAGMGIQLLFIIIFCCFAVRLLYQLVDRSNTPSSSSLEQDTRDYIRLLSSIFFALLMIVLRIIFRMYEYAQGLDSSVPNHEVYQYCLDSLPMLLALAVFNFIQPGKILQKQHKKAASKV